MLYSLLFLTTANAHSWVRCTNYAAEITGNDYDESQCNGWIRDWEFNNINFAQDRGINFQVGVGSGQPLCGPNTMNGNADNAYSSDYANADKLARYTVGSTIRVVWPAKNHANYECSQNIPDTSMKLFMNPNVNPSSDLANTQGSMEANGWQLVKDWQEGCTAGTDGCGFQNCPKFCDGTDSATCFQDFVVPSVSSSGYYTFVWYWVFNPGTPYISCWEAYIDTNGQTSQPDEPTSGDPNAGKTIDGYVTEIPYCITGKTYDETGMNGFSNLQFKDEAGDDEITVVNPSQSGTNYNMTVQIQHLNNQVAEITRVGEEDFCEEFVILYGSATTCSQCGEIMTVAIYDAGWMNAPCLGIFVWILVSFLM